MPTSRPDPTTPPHKVAKHLAATILLQEFSPGKLIYQEESFGASRLTTNAWYLVVSGEVELAVAPTPRVRRLAGPSPAKERPKEPMTVTTIPAGSIFGQLELLAGFPRCTQAAAGAAGCVILRIPKARIVYDS